MTRSLNTVIPRVHPTRSAITVAGIVGTSTSCSRMASSNASTAEPLGRRSYFGGASEAIAARTVFRETPNVLAIVLIGNPSARRSLRISAQSSTDNNSFAPIDSSESTVRSKGVNIRPTLRGQFSAVADNRRSDQVPALRSDAEQRSRPW